MKNFKRHGESITVTAGVGGIATGGVVLAGALVGIAVASAAQGESVTVSLNGVYSGLPKATGAAWVQGDKLYWDSTASNFTKTSSSNTFAGYADVDAASGDAVGDVILRQ